MARDTGLRNLRLRLCAAPLHRLMTRELAQACQTPGLVTLKTVISAAAARAGTGAPGVEASVAALQVCGKSMMLVRPPSSRPRAGLATGAWRWDSRPPTAPTDSPGRMSAGSSCSPAPGVQGTRPGARTHGLRQGPRRPGSQASLMRATSGADAWDVVIVPEPLAGGVGPYHTSFPSGNTLRDPLREPKTGPSDISGNA